MLRMVPFLERNYNLVELGPRGTGKSHLATGPWRYGTHHITRMEITDRPQQGIGL